MDTIKRIEELTSRSLEIAKQYGLDGEMDRLSEMIAKAKQNEMSVVVCGEFKRGKSSFINAFLGEDICPVNDGITTSTVSLIKYGEKKRVIRHFGNVMGESIKVETEEIPFSNIESFAVGTSTEIDNTIMLEIEIPNERLKSGLRVIDTPGVGSLDPRHLFLTLYAMPKADMVLFMTDCGEPMTSTEMGFFKDHIAKSKLPAKILVGKSDNKTKDEMDVIIADTKKKIKENCSMADVDVIPVSAEKWKAFNENPDSERNRQKSNCDAVLEAISKIENEAKSRVEESIRNMYIDIMDNVAKAILIKSENIANANNANELQKLHDELNRLQQLRNDVLNENSELRKNISNKLKNSQRVVFDQLSKDNVLLSTQKLNSVLDQEEAAIDGGEKFVVDQIKKAIAELSINLDAMIEKDFGEIKESVEVEINAPSSECYCYVPENIREFHVAFADKLHSVLQHSLPGVGVSALVGMISLPVGLCAGIVFVIRSIIKNKKMQRIQNIRQQITPQITIAMNELRSYVQKRYEDFGNAIVDSLKQVADSLTKQIQEIYDAMKVCQQNEAQKKNMLMELQGQKTFVEGMIQQAKVFNTNPFSK